MAQNHSENRQKRFLKWWKKNSHNPRGHHWLVKHSQRVLHDYAVPPDMWTECKRIIKRYHLSEYKRINMTDSYTLWRVCFPLMDERIKRLETTAAHFGAMVEQHKKISKKG